MAAEVSSVFQRILNDLFDAFRNGRIKAGDKLPPERQWAEALGVSRSTLREAIRAFEILGVFRCIQGGGTFLNTDYSQMMFQPMTISYYLNNGTIQNLQEFRRTLELCAVRLAAEKASEDDLRELEQIFDCIHRLGDRNQDVGAGAKYDQMFHQKIAAISGNCLIRDALASSEVLINHAIADLRIEVFKDSGNMTELENQHQKLIDAIGRHDPEQAYRAMEEHLDFVESFTPAILAAKKEEYDL